jgi:hypothetical protein
MRSRLTSSPPPSAPRGRCNCNGARSSLNIHPTTSGRHFEACPKAIRRCC